MTRVNVTELRRHLPAYLKRAQQGQRIHITSHGKVIAELSPPLPAADEAAAARALLRGSVRRYDRPLEPAIPPEAWDANG